MVEQAKSFGLRFQPKAEAAVIPTQDTSEYVAPSATAMQHESLRGLWWIAEYIPKRIKDPTHNFAERWIIHAGRHRHVNENSNIHASVFERKDKRPTYRPPNLPSNFVKIE